MKSILKLAVLCLVLLPLAACMPGDNIGATLSPAETAAVQDVAGLAAARSTTVAGLVTKGQLFCAHASPFVGMAEVVVALITNGQSFSVLNKAAEDVANACKLVGGVPVPAPADAGSVPVISTT